MKIGLVCPYNVFKNGGVQECVIALRAEYERLGYEAHIITPRPKGVEVESVDGILLIGESRDFNNPIFHTTGQISVSFDNAAISEFLKTHSFDILHFHEPWVPMVSRQILTRSNAVNIATFHAKLPETMMSKTIEKVITPYTKSILKYINSYTAVSEAAAEYVHSLTDEQITLIPNAIEVDKFIPNTKNTVKQKTIVFVGRLEKRKGVIYLLKAFKELQKDDTESKLLITGDGPERSRLEDYVHANRLKNVEFLGFVDEATKIELLQTATIYCSPAMYGESFGIVLLEAMAAGAVTIAGNNPGYASVMQDKGSISLVNVKDTDQFALRLKLLMNDQDMRKLWIDWASDYVQQFNYKRVANLYLDVYKHALKVRK